MTVVRRYGGWKLSPSFVVNSPTTNVTIAIDDENLTQWAGEPVTVWQTPLSEIRNMEVEVGRRIKLRATIAGARYTWTNLRGVEHDELIEALRQRGARIIRRNRAVALTAAAVAVVMIVASLASIATVFRHSAKPTRLQVGAVNVRRTDLPINWAATSASLLSLLKGERGDVTTSSTVPPKPSAKYAVIAKQVATNFQRCMGVSNADDRMFGKAGVIPWLQVSGATFATQEFKGSEIGSLTQYYDTESMVQADLAEYSKPNFGKCWAIAGAQILLTYATNSATVPKTTLVATTYIPLTFALGWRRGGIVNITLPHEKTVLTLEAVLVARGNYEVAFYALTGDWRNARAVFDGALGAVLGRLVPGTGPNAA